MTGATARTNLTLAILDDYQRMALRAADWERLRGHGVELTVFEQAFASQDDAAARLAPIDIVLLMRERRPFPRALLERLRNLNRPRRSAFEHDWDY